MKKVITKSKIIIAVIFLILGGNVSAQNDTQAETKERFKHNLGFGAGVSTGHGLSYKYFGKKLGAQVNFAPFKDETKVIMSTGLTLLLRLVELEKISFFVYQGNHFYFEEESYTYTEYGYDEFNGTQTSNEVTYSNERKELNTGAGIGLEFMPHKRIAFNIMGGYGGQDSFRKISFTGETSIYFKF